MGRNLFTQKGHIVKKVFMSQSGAWQDSISTSELVKIANHLKECDKCRKAEIDAILHCAERAAGKTIVEFKDEVDTKAFNYSKEDTVNVLPFDKYPVLLQEYILQFTKGQLINFIRDEEGRLERITGKTDGDIESVCIFVQDGPKMSVHCHCHNCESEPQTEDDRMTFADFHIDFTLKNLIAFTLDITEFVPEKKQVKKFNYNFKLYTNDSGKVVKILHNSDRFYLAEYDCNQNLVRELNGKSTTVFDYADNKKTGIKTSYSDGVECNLSLEYADKLEVPTKIYSTHNNDTRLIQVNKIMNPCNKKPFVEMIHDGITRGYYDQTGLLNVKVLLPEIESVKMVAYSLDDFKEHCGSLRTIDAVIADPRTMTMRILKKVDGERRLDQTATYRDGLIVKVFNHKDVVFTSVLSSHFSSRHWSDIIEKNDGIL